MANRFLKPERIVNQGLGLLLNQLLLARLVGRYTRADFAGTKNDTFDIRIPSLLRGREYEWRTRNNPIEVDELIEYKVSVSLDKHPYSAVPITDEERTLDITNWGSQVAFPQIRAVAERLEGYVAATMERTARYRHTVSYVDGGGGDDDYSFYNAIVEARKYLNVENVPAQGRKILLGANVEAAALRSKHLVKVNEAGTDGMLREAIIGRILGMEVIGNCNSIDPDFAVAFHPTAFALANVAPVVPESVTSGATATFEQYSMRWIRDYDPQYMRERSIYSAFAGTASVEDGRDLDPESLNWGELTGENVRAVEIAFTPGS